MSIEDEAEKKKFLDLWRFYSAQNSETEATRRTPLPTISQVPSVALCLTCRLQAEPDAWAPRLASGEVLPFCGDLGANCPTPIQGSVRSGVTFLGHPELSSLPREDGRSPRPEDPSQEEEPEGNKPVPNVELTDRETEALGSVLARVFCQKLTAPSLQSGGAEGGKGRWSRKRAGTAGTEHVRDVHSVRLLSQRREL